MDTVYLTRTGLEKLRRDLEHLVKIIRPEVTASLALARSHGDLSENAEYHAAREHLADVDRKIEEIHHQMTKVEIIDENSLNSDEVRILSKVTLRDVSNSREFQYTLVDPLQSDPSRNLISVKSPIGQGLLGKRVGDESVINIPAGELTLKVMAIEKSEGL